MFLTSKSSSLQNKSKGNPNNKQKKALGGWQDDDQLPTIKETLPQAQLFTQQSNPFQQQQELLSSKSANTYSKQTHQEVVKQTYTYFDWDQLNMRTDIECEKQLVESLLQLGGIRVKPNDNMLSEFFKEIRGMEVSNIASLLLSKLEVNYSFQAKAKALYTIEFLIKKSNEFLSYFKRHADKLRDFPQPEDNLQNYRKLQKTVLNLIGGQVNKTHSEEYKPVFADPGYYQQPPKSQLDSFIQQNANKTKKTEHKRQIIGPGQVKIKMPEKQQISNKLVGPPVSGQANLLDLEEPLPAGKNTNDLLI